MNLNRRKLFGIIPLSFFSASGAASPASIKVKPLQWNKAFTGVSAGQRTIWYYASLAHGRACSIFPVGETMWRVVEQVSSDLRLPWEGSLLPTLEEAKAHVEENWRRYVLSLLEK